MKNVITIEDTPEGIKVSVDYRENQFPTVTKHSVGQTVSRHAESNAEMLVARVMVYIHSPARLAENLVVVDELLIEKAKG